MAVLWMGGGLCCTCAVAAFAYLRSPRRPVTVNCHFCNTDHQVTVVGNLIDFVIFNNFLYKYGTVWSCSVVLLRSHIDVLRKDPYVFSAARIRTQ
jgi:hypothetical protein